MSPGTAAVVGGIAVLLVVVFIFYQQQQQAAEAVRFGRSNQQQIGQGVGSLVSGIIGMATGGGGAAA